MEIGEYGSGALLRRYIPGHTVDQRVAMVEANGDTFYYHANRIGSVQALVGGCRVMVKFKQLQLSAFTTHGECVRAAEMGQSPPFSHSVTSLTISTVT